MTKREKATLALWEIMGNYDLGKSNNDVVRDMYSFTYMVLMLDMTYINIADCSAKFIKLLTKFSSVFNTGDKPRLTEYSDYYVYITITKSALMEFSWYLLHQKNFIKKWVYVKDALAQVGLEI